MRNIVGTFAAILLSLGINAAQDKTISKPNETTLIANERALGLAVAKADKASFSSLVLPEGVWTTKTGFVPMNLLADGLEDFQVPQWEIVNPHVIWMDENSAIVLYVRTGGGTFHDRPFAATSLASTVWAKRNGKWLALHHQETDLTR
jgi:hypothetical protein